MKKLLIPLTIILVPLILKAQVRISLQEQGEMTFDFSSVANYPPSIYPTYYYPTSASGNNPEGIRITVVAFAWGGSSITLHLDIRGASNFSPSIALSQLYYAPNGTPLPAPGTADPASWTPVSTSWTEFWNATMSGWILIRRIDLDFCFKGEADDDPTGPPGVSTTLYIRYYGL